MKNRSYRFGTVEIDVQNLRVTVDSEIRSLEPKSFRLLLFLVENRGRAIPKDEIISAVWSDTFVSDNSLAKAIAQIRKALDDDPKAPRYVETVPSVGYRFVAEVEEDFKQEIETEEPARDQTGASPAVPSRRTLLWAAGVAGVLLLNAGVWYWKLRTGAAPPQRLVPVTTYAGSERYPSFSPDGRQVAFYWNGEKGANPGIYVKLLGDPHALRLTSGPDAFPVWSPDGKRIAFVRGERPGRGRLETDLAVAGTGHGIYTVSALGGIERKVLDVEVRGQISWSPDGKWLALAIGGAGESAIFVVPPEGGDPRRISAPGNRYDIWPAFSPDGRRLAYAVCPIRNPWSCEVYIRQLGTDAAPEGSPRQVTHQAVEIYGITWSRDGRSLIYSAAHTILTPYLWRVDSDGRQAPERLEIAGARAFAPSASPVADNLVFEKSLVDVDIWRYRAGAGMEPLITSSLRDFTPQYSPDGTRIAFCSDRAGEGTEIWVTQADGTGPVQLTNGPGRNQGSPSWSSDGRWIVFDSEGKDGHFEIYVIEATGGLARRITSESWNAFMPFWGPDGKWIYFLGTHIQIWRAPSAGGRAEQVTTHGAQVGHVSADGALLFYQKRSESEVFARNLSGGEEQPVLSNVYWRAFFPAADGIYYIGLPSDDGFYPLEFYQFSTKTSRLLEKIGGYVDQGLSVSPDGKSILFSRSVNTGTDLMMIEHF